MGITHVNNSCPRVKLLGKDLRHLTVAMLELWLGSTTLRESCKSLCPEVKKSRGFDRNPQVLGTRKPFGAKRLKILLAPKNSKRPKFFSPLGF